MPFRPSADEPVARLAHLIAEAPRPLALRGHLQPYAWGGFDYLQDLTGLDVPPGVPAAEWWVGAHPSAPSLVTVGADACRLDLLVARQPAAMLGASVAARFGDRLPFLFKVLDVHHMLSIQAHPTRAQAQAGFARENAAGLPLDAPTRNYRDDNHKPEAQVALSEFWLLAGFRPCDEIVDVLAARPELQALSDWLAVRLHGPAAAESAAAHIRALYEHIMRLSQDDIDLLVSPLVDRLGPLHRAGRLDRASPDFWAARAAGQFALAGGHHDRGILSIYLLNLLRLEPGEGTYLGAGLLHAYLEGQVVEVMANSDNVLRGGLTPKHVDVDELLRVVSFAPMAPQPLERRQAGPCELAYRTPADEFGIGRLELVPGAAVSTRAIDGPHLVVTVDGRARLRWPAGELALGRGAAVLIPPGVDYTLTTEDRAAVFRVFVPPPS